MKKQTIVSLIMVLIAVPITIFAGMYLFEDRKYYFISMMLLLEMLVPFLIMYEGREHKARELVVISVLSAIVVVSRLAFSMVHFFKPMSAIIMVSGMALGAEAGFLVGALGAFVSNFQFGQGPWTPWQMFAWGMMGFLAPIVFRCKKLRNSRIAMCVFGFLAVFLVYGPIVNIGSAFMMQADPTASAILESCKLGMPFDAIHATATALFMLLAGKAMLEVLDRVKSKYGL